MPTSIDLGHTVVRVPGSTSNIGPGFDCMGIALQLYNDIRVARLSEGGSESPPHEMVASTASRFFAAAKVAPFAFEWSIQGDVPISRGLGSSVTLRHGILQGLNTLSGNALDGDALFRLSAALEGHPDNASAGAYGGFTCTNAVGTCLYHPVDARLTFLLLIPEREVLTEASRSALPSQLAHREAVESLGNASVITAAFASQRYESLKGSFTDYLHQPYRSVGNPGLSEVISAGEHAGALGGFLSGSGSTIACVALDDQADCHAIGKAMQRAYEAIGPSRLITTKADNEGARTLESDER